MRGRRPWGGGLGGGPAPRGGGEHWGGVGAPGKKTRNYGGRPRKKRPPLLARSSRPRSRPRRRTTLRRHYWGPASRPKTKKVAPTRAEPATISTSSSGRQNRDVASKLRESPAPRIFAFWVRLRCGVADHLGKRIRDMAPEFFRGGNRRACPLEEMAEVVESVGLVRRVTLRVFLSEVAVAAFFAQRDRIFEGRAHESHVAINEERDQRASYDPGRRILPHLVFDEHDQRVVWTEPFGQNG